MRPRMEYIEAAAKEGATRRHMLCTTYGPIDHSFCFWVAEVERAAYPTISTDCALDEKLPWDRQGRID